MSNTINCSVIGHKTVDCATVLFCGVTLQVHKGSPTLLTHTRLGVAKLVHLRGVRIVARSCETFMLRFPYEYALFPVDCMSRVNSDAEENN